MRIGGRAAVIAPGRYAYCGSAYGPGGIAGRVRRHLRRGKRPHWHIDRLTESGEIAWVAAVPNGRECALLRRLLDAPWVAPAAPGFGSSDCRACPTHLVKLPAGLDGAGLAALLGATLPAAAALWSTWPVAGQARDTA